jgi:hypothetical protein
MTKIAGSGSASLSISQRHGSADPDPDPDPPQNVMDPQHWFVMYLETVMPQPGAHGTVNDDRQRVDGMQTKHH